MLKQVTSAGLLEATGVSTPEQVPVGLQVLL